MPLLLQACPSFQAAWQKYVETEGEDLLYVSLGNFADHLLELHQKNHTKEFPAVADAILDLSEMDYEILCNHQP